MPFSVRHP